MKLEVDYRIVPRSGEHVSGDAALVREDGGRILLAVIDALGHGPKAAEIADAAIEKLRSISISSALHAAKAVHEQLRGTRGAAAMICCFEGGRLEGCGVGNVGLRASSSVQVVLSPGILGQQVRRFQTFSAELAVGDRLYIYSDGVSSHLELDRVSSLPPGSACSAVMANHRRDYDDATIMVAEVKETG
jgi:phosphoserine phosphatase RsbX